MKYYLKEAERLEVELPLAKEKVIKNSSPISIKLRIFKASQPTGGGSAMSK